MMEIDNHQIPTIVFDKLEFLRFASIVIEDANTAAAKELLKVDVIDPANVDPDDFKFGEMQIPAIDVGSELQADESNFVTNVLDADEGNEVQAVSNCESGGGERIIDWKIPGLDAWDEAMDLARTQCISKEEENRQQHHQRFCEICQGEYSDEDLVVRLPCKHFFHRGCILR